MSKSPLFGERSNDTAWLRREVLTLQKKLREWQANCRDQVRRKRETQKKLLEVRSAVRDMSSVISELAASDSSVRYKLLQVLEELKRIGIESEQQVHD